MRYLVLDTNTRTIKILNQPGDPALTQPLPSKADRWANVRSDAWSLQWDHISNKVLHQVLYPAQYARDRARGVTGKKYMLWAPDPWLVAIGMVMRDGIIAGASWDVVKWSVEAALAKLRRAGVAPATSKSKSKELATTSLGFRYTVYTEEGKQHEMFLGLQRHYEREVTTAKSLSTKKRKKS
jgi:hypothetical protein